MNMKFDAELLDKIEMDVINLKNNLNLLNEMLTQNGEIGVNYNTFKDVQRIEDEVKSLNGQVERMLSKSPNEGNTIAEKLDVIIELLKKEKE